MHVCSPLSILPELQDMSSLSYISRIHFNDIDDIRSNTMTALKAIPQNQLQNCLKGGLGAGMGA
jgi:hypothetical protein